MSAQISFLDVLLLGATGGKCELLFGRVSNTVRADSPADAHALRLALALEAAAILGEAIVDDGSELHVGRFHFALEREYVHVLTDVDRTDWDRFG